MLSLRTLALRQSKLGADKTVSILTLDDVVPYCIVIAIHCSVATSPDVSLVLVSSPYIVLHSSIDVSYVDL